jgi:chromosome transmission fidelity protein 1
MPGPLSICFQIIFCSRTHSQLSQFVAELRRTGFADRLSVVALASRGVLCVNDEVRKLEVPGLMNERCLDLQQVGCGAVMCQGLLAR